MIADSVFAAGSPFWSPDSRTLYYEKQDRLMAAALAGTDSLWAASYRVIADSIDGFVVDLHPDGRRFLVMGNETAPADTSVRRLIAVTGWLTVLRERLAESDR